MLKKLLNDYKALLCVSPIYFVFRIFFLAKLPIFNDEAIYLDWGWRALHLPGAAYLALTDGKQPLQIWLFGVLQSVISHPLVAGRLLSVIIGFSTFICIYLITKRVVDERFAALASLLYAVIPLFAFFDRQALMESAMAAVGLWSLYLVLSLLERHAYRDVILLGAVLGIGFFIKSTALIFLLMTLCAAFFAFITKKVRSRDAWKDLLLAAVGSQLILIPLYLQKVYWETLSMNSRYSLGIGEILQFPIHVWMNNISSFLQISLWQITPFLFLLSIVGVTLTLRQRSLYRWGILFWMVGTTAVFLLVAKTVTVRYAEPFLPPATIFMAYALSWIFEKKKTMACTIGGLSTSVATLFSVLLIVAPLTYFSVLNTFTNYSQKYEYVSSWTSGYAVTDATTYIRESLSEKRNIISTALETGNPQNAVATYFHDNPSVILAYLDSQMFASDINQFDCLSSAIPLYFVSRENQIAGLDKFLVLNKTFDQPEGGSFVNVYILKKHCTGKTLDITPN